MIHLRWLVGLSSTLVLAAVTVSAPSTEQAGRVAVETQAATPPASVTLPFTLDHNRMVVEVEFVGASGTVRKARAWVDTGSETLILAESLAQDLGLDLSPLKEAGTEHSMRLPSPAPPVSLGGMPLPVAEIPLSVHPGVLVRPGVTAEVNLPASALRHHDVVLDYPAGRITIAQPGMLKPRGVAIPCRVNPVTGLFLVTATLDGEAVTLGVDTGSAGTWVSNQLTASWQTRHPDWPRSVGAVGSANFFGFGFEPKGVLMSLPELGIGPLRVNQVGLLGLDQDLFDWYSKKSAGVVAGFIGANVLRAFRLEIDFPRQMTYWERGPVPQPNDLDIVGLTLRAESDGGFTVAGVAVRNDRPAVEGVEPGDRLIKVDALEATNAPMGAVVNALRGEPGAKRTLVIERAGKQVTIQATVTRFP